MIQVENVRWDFDETMCNGETCNYRLQTMWNSNLWNEFSLRIVAMVKWDDQWEELFDIWLIFYSYFIEILLMIHILTIFNLKLIKIFYVLEKLK